MLFTILTLKAMRLFRILPTAYYSINSIFNNKCNRLQINTNEPNLVIFLWEKNDSYFTLNEKESTKAVHHSDILR